MTFTHSRRYVAVDQNRAKRLKLNATSSNTIVLSLLQIKTEPKMTTHCMKCRDYQQQLEDEQQKVEALNFQLKVS